ncbi:toxin-antitoxin system YwqK family antitoxin [Saccharicrinis aurantiacus]|uniref:toxin-antitoxin system YwqK family antitoxin n=1 Tax=Saccharicrinis aurantiacus TaxID=1849719 RepID=UPI00094FCE65|nr:hypothetical protein [Saccharicrinis aurantiacus]
MRIFFTIFALISFVTVSFAQLIQKEDGLYYTKDGELYSGTYVEHYPNGSIRLEMNVVDGKKQGSSSYYFEDKSKQEVRFYADNEMDGVWETWNEEGVKVGVASYKKGLKHGIWKIYDEKGTLRYDMSYKNGKKSGTWKIFGDDGKLTATKKY